MTNFYSIQFLLFLIAALLGYYTVFRKKQWLCLLLASIVFYAWTGIENFVFLLLVGGTTWAGARVLGRYAAELSLIKKDKTIEKAEKDLRKAAVVRKRRMVMWSVVLLNFALLFYIKVPDNALGLVLPLGISFYMFQSIGYLLGIYNEKYEPEQNFARYMLFVSYFPQMIQGPINRYDAIGQQFMEEHKWNGEVATKALYRIFYGLFKKYAIANIFAGMIATIFDTPVRDYAGCTVLLGILLYSAQQYADFSGGIDMVLGVSELFGIQMAENFKQPYFSTSLGDFWRRWHISLGKWMRDYVFYPFALTKPMKNMGKWANKKLSKHLGRVLPAALGNILVFFVVGIWHGTQWHYVIWGLYNGFVIACSDIMAPVFEKVKATLHIDTKAGWYHVFQIIRTFIVVNIGWYFDRIADIKVAFYSLKKTIFNFDMQLFDMESKIVFYDYPDHALPMAIVACIFVFIVSVLEERNVSVRDALYAKPVVVRWLVYFFVIGMILVASTSVNGTGGFMYANF
ncbi:MAG: MBOAT family protein [Roseburia sp.]|nr:MBOAT family protein [Roseburia sp.]